MTCKKAAYWLQLYTDGRLDRSRLARLELHLHGCAECREEGVLLQQIREGARESELVAEPGDLTARIMARVSAYEAARARGAEDWLAGVPAWALSWRSIVVAVSMVLGLTVLVEPAAVGHLVRSLAGQLASAYTLLLTPGPDSISWGVWVGGLAAALMFVVWFARADASSSLRRAIAQRLPQLW